VFTCIFGVSDFNINWVMWVIFIPPHLPFIFKYESEDYVKSPDFYEVTNKNKLGSFIYCILIIRIRLLDRNDRTHQHEYT